MLKEAFKKTNSELCKRNFEVNFSGTTACVVILSGDAITAANVGDSRAIMATCSGKQQGQHLRLEVNYGKPGSLKKSTTEVKWTVTALSRDHKPDNR